MTAMTLNDGLILLVAALVLIGAGLSLLGAFGLVRLQSFYDRVHAPTLGSTLGMALLLVASWVFFGVTEGRWLPRELLIAIFLTVTTPVTLILLARAALFRDRTEESEPGEKSVPAAGAPSKTVKPAKT